MPPRNPSQEWLGRLASSFERLSAAITARKPDGELVAIFDEARVLCEGDMPNASRAAQEMLPQLKMAVETWQSVWGRLGAQQEFRLAVAREAELWARRLRAMGEGTPSSHTP